MTLQEAMATGKAFKRPGMSDYYVSVVDMLSDEGGNELDALRASDYEVENVSFEVNADDFGDLMMEAWNSSLPRGGSVARAESSAFFRNFKAKLLVLIANEG